MTEQEINNWLYANELILNKKQKLTDVKIKEIVDVYCALTGEKKKITSCAKCIFNMIDRLKAQLIKLKLSGYTAHIYRTNFGYLTLSETKNIAYTVFVKDQNELLNKLNEYKALEKTE